MIGRGFGLLSIALICLALWGLIRQVRKPQPLRPSGNLIGIVMAPVMLLVNLIVLRQAAPGLLGPALLIFGLGFWPGLGTGRQTPSSGRTGRRRAIDPPLAVLGDFIHGNPNPGHLRYRCLGSRGVDRHVLCDWNQFGHQRQFAGPPTPIATVVGSMTVLASCVHVMRVCATPKPD